VLEHDFVLQNRTIRFAMNARSRRFPVPRAISLSRVGSRRRCLHNGVHARARRSGYENVDARRSINPGPVSVYLSGPREYRSYRSRMSRRAYLRASPTKVSGFLSARLTTRGDSRPPPSLLPVYSTLRIQLSLSPFADTRDPVHIAAVTFPRPSRAWVFTNRDNSRSSSYRDPDYQTNTIHSDKQSFARGRSSQNCGS